MKRKGTTFPDTCPCCEQKSLGGLCLGCRTGRNKHCATCQSMTPEVLSPDRLNDLLREALEMA